MSLAVSESALTSQTSSLQLANFLTTNGRIRYVPAELSRVLIEMNLFPHNAVCQTMDVSLLKAYTCAVERCADRQCAVCFEYHNCHSVCHNANLGQSFEHTSLCLSCFTRMANADQSETDSSSDSTEQNEASQPHSALAASVASNELNVDCSNHSTGSNSSNHANSIVKHGGRKGCACPSCRCTINCLYENTECTEHLFECKCGMRVQMDQNASYLSEHFVGCAQSYVVMPCGFYCQFADADAHSRTCLRCLQGLNESAVGLVNLIKQKFVENNQSLGKQISELRDKLEEREQLHQLRTSIQDPILSLFTSFLLHRP